MMSPPSSDADREMVASPAAAEIARPQAENATLRQTVATFDVPARRRETDEAQTRQRAGLKVADHMDFHAVVIPVLGRAVPTAGQLGGDFGVAAAPLPGGITGMASTNPANDAASPVSRNHSNRAGKQSASRFRRCP